MAHDDKSVEALFRSTFRMREFRRLLQEGGSAGGGGGGDEEYWAWWDGFKSLIADSRLHGFELFCWRSCKMLSILIGLQNIVHNNFPIRSSHRL